MVLLSSKSNEFISHSLYKKNGKNMVVKKWDSVGLTESHPLARSN